MNTDVTLMQKRFLNQTIFSIRRNSEMLITQKSPFHTRESPIEISAINPNPHLLKGFSYKNITWAGIFLFTAAFILLVGSPNAENFTAIVAFVMLFTIVGLSNIWLAIKNHQNHFVFTNRNTGNIAFSMKANKPSKNDVSNFIAQLEQRINSINYPESIPIEQKIDIYKKHLEFLLSEGVLSENAFKESIENLKLKSKPAQIIKLAET